MKSALALAIFALLLTSLTAQAQHRLHNDDDRVYFDNRTSSMLSIYKAPISSRSRPVKSLESGDICSLPSGANVQWVVATPVWYRLVSSIMTSERGHNRLVIRDSELRAIGGTPVTSNFTNRSGTPVKVKIVVDGKELDWLWIKPGRSANTASFARQKWIIREQTSGKLLQRATTGNGTTNIQINPRSQTRDPHHGHNHAVEPVELTITNTTAHTINIYRKTTFGSRKVGSIASRRSATIDTKVGEVWRIEDSITLEVLETITVPKNDPHCKVSVASKRTRPAPQRRTPAAPSKITMEIHNDSDMTVNLYKKKDGKWKYTKRIYPNREYELEFTPGRAVSIRDPKSGKEIRGFNAPSKDTAMHFSSPSTKPAPRTKPTQPERSSETIRPRDIIRRIIRGE